MFTSRGERLLEFCLRKFLNSPEERNFLPADLVMASVPRWVVVLQWFATMLGGGERIAVLRGSCLTAGNHIFAWQLQLRHCIRQQEPWFRQSSP